MELNKSCTNGFTPIRLVFHLVSIWARDLIPIQKPSDLSSDYSVSMRWRTRPPIHDGTLLHDLYSAPNVAYFYTWL